MSKVIEEHQNTNSTGDLHKRVKKLHENLSQEPLLQLKISIENIASESS